eukprot:TRINITY_DN3980_c0_g1_i1.p1 TRINITY_DN3980_c0_g1~~TRINITY_DN3980_c0_g1_i1.p1  ORF type:complete len:61 (+),score=6.66 TRINITY_DN3980_c0_g1_i1:3-185(+)
MKGEISNDPAFRIAYKPIVPHPLIYINKRAFCWKALRHMNSNAIKKTTTLKFALASFIFQ